MSCACSINALEPFELDYYVGDTVGIAATVTDGAGAAFDLTACAFSFTVTDPSVTPALTVWDRSIGQGVAILSAVGGLALITPSPAESAALVAGRTYTARVVITDSAGAIITTATGYLAAR
jgi:hypothetical protein